MLGRPHRHHHHGQRPHGQETFEGRSSRLYDVLARSLLRGLYRRFARDVAVVAPRNAAVLDIGTGPGVLLAELARSRPDLRLTGVDLSTDMITAAQRNLRAYGDRTDAQVADVTDLPFDDDRFDLVVSSLSTHHWDEPAAAVRELARVLRPGGRLLLYDFHFAPFDEITETAETIGLAAGAPEQSRFRTWVPLFPRCLRYDLPTHTPGDGRQS